MILERIRLEYFVYCQLVFCIFDKNLQTYHMYSTLKRRGNGREIHVVFLLGINVWLITKVWEPTSWVNSNKSLVFLIFSKN